MVRDENKDHVKNITKVYILESLKQIDEKLKVVNSFAVRRSMDQDKKRDHALCEAEEYFAQEVSKQNLIKRQDENRDQYFDCYNSLKGESVSDNESLDYSKPEAHGPICCHPVKLYHEILQINAKLYSKPEALGYHPVKLSHEILQINDLSTDKFATIFSIESPAELIIGTFANSLTDRFSIGILLELINSIMYNIILCVTLQQFAHLKPKAVIECAIQNSKRLMQSTKEKIDTNLSTEHATESELQVGELSSFKIQNTDQESIKIKTQVEEQEESSTTLATEQEQNSESTVGLELPTDPDEAGLVSSAKLRSTANVHVSDMESDEAEATVKEKTKSKSRLHLHRHLLRFHIPDGDAKLVRPLYVKKMKANREDTDISSDEESGNLAYGSKSQSYFSSCGDWCYVPSEDCFYYEDSSADSLHESDCEDPIPNGNHSKIYKQNNSRVVHEKSSHDRLSQSSHGSFAGMPLIVIMEKSTNSSSTRAVIKEEEM